MDNRELTRTGIQAKCSHVNICAIRYILPFFIIILIIVISTAYQEYYSSAYVDNNLVQMLIGNSYPFIVDIKAPGYYNIKKIA